MNSVNSRGTVVMVEGNPYYWMGNAPAFENIAKRDLYRTARHEEGLQALVDHKQLIPMGMSGQQDNSSAAYQQNYGQPTQYTPNQANAQQIAGFGRMSAPQWMMNAYTNRIGSMGGNANPPVPFNVTPGGFGGKTAPTGGQ